MRIQVAIGGMLAVHAKQAVFTALGAVEGITRAEVELGRATLELDVRATEPTTRAATIAAMIVSIKAAIEATGYEVESVTTLPRTLPML